MTLEHPTIASHLQPFVDNHTLAGAVTLVASRDEILSLEAVGYADIANKKPMSTDSLFWIASQTKPMTAAALMILVDKGMVNIEDPVEKYLPEFKDLWLAVERDEDHILLKRPSRLITVRHILNHTSGLPFSSALEQPTLDRISLQDAVLSYAMTPLQSEPGSVYQYSNAGINIVGRIIEVVSDISYEWFMSTRLFTPLGMNDTWFWPNEWQLPRLAKAYKPNADNIGLEETTISQLQYPLDDPMRTPMPAGGLFSTAADVCRFCQMVLNGGIHEGKPILSERAVKEMTTRHTPPGMEGYGLGWSVGDTTFGHGGALSTNMTIDPGRNLITVFLVQHAGYPGPDAEKVYPAFQNAASQFAKSQ